MKLSATMTLNAIGTLGKVDAELIVCIFDVNACGAVPLAGTTIGIENATGFVVGSATGGRNSVDVVGTEEGRTVLVVTFCGTNIGNGVTVASNETGGDGESVVRCVGVNVGVCVDRVLVEIDLIGHETGGDCGGRMGRRVGLDVGERDDTNGEKFHFGPIYRHPSCPYSVRPGQSSSSPALCVGPFPHWISLYKGRPFLDPVGPSPKRSHTSFIVISPNGVSTTTVPIS
jgi:hypothetical protein